MAFLSYFDLDAVQEAGQWSFVYTFLNSYLVTYVQDIPCVAVELLP